jgi:hypothetical protein
MFVTDATVIPSLRKASVAIRFTRPNPVVTNGLSPSSRTFIVIPLALGVLRLLVVVEVLRGQVGHLLAASGADDLVVLNLDLVVLARSLVGGLSLCSNVLGEVSDNATLSRHAESHDPRPLDDLRLVGRDGQDTIYDGQFALVVVEAPVSRADRVAQTNYAALGHLEFVVLGSTGHQCAPLSDMKWGEAGRSQTPPLTATA